jgi:alginate O-acetyltransferase complex protein AlgI
LTWIPQLLSALSPHPGDPLVFPSGLFLWAFSVFALAHALLRKRPEARKLLFIAFSLWFYWRCSGTYALLLVATSLVDWFVALRIQAATSKRARGWFLATSIVSNLGVLAWFKYANFGLGTAATLTGGTFHPLSIVLPVGISFYTFQSLSYTIDVWRGEIRALVRYRDFLFFASFFPQLVAGPIVRAKQFLPQMETDLHPDASDRSRALRLVVAGLLKKVVVADFIAQNFVDLVFSSPLRHTGAECWLAAYGYALQIYCDFSGYTDMAIGIALFLGFRLPDNFDRPYAATSLTDFWRRWHMSLSTWLRDYLYIPLGGNRKGRVRTYLNLFLTMLLGGLWHGASWKFVLWGGIHGAGLALEKLLRIPDRLNRSRTRRIVGTVVTFHIVAACWILFRSPTLSDALDFFSRLGTAVDLATFSKVLAAFPAVFLLMAAGYLLQLLPWSWDAWWERGLLSIGWIGRLLVLALAAWVAIQVRGAQIQPFIYFQF